MKASDYSKPIDIRRYTHSQSAGGRQTGSWTTIASGVWAKVKQYSGAERMKFGALQSDVTHRVLIQAPVEYGSPATQVDAKDVFVFEGRQLNIKTITRLEEGRVHNIEFLCTEGTADLP